MAVQIENLSSDLIWECTRKQNAFLVKRKQGGGAQFSRDPFNLVNKHSRKYAGYCNAQAIGIKADDNTVELKTKYGTALTPPCPHPPNPTDVMMLMCVSADSPTASTSPRRSTRSPPSRPRRRRASCT
ncbi:hypothetical protein LTR53_014681 [Teratosphaeriaceae sp. CCFEE 6253]|nr:hypothetical protein LTR53_014681 [Teratosphaeriaceae sp. CCFEE 6253]